MAKIRGPTDLCSVGWDVHAKMIQAILLCSVNTEQFSVRWIQCLFSLCA